MKNQWELTTILSAYWLLMLRLAWLWINAPQESAANIATMLGKVMDGQTEALSRYGYKFDETQEKILKYFTEEERCAVLTEVVTSSIGGMNEAL